MIGILNAGDLNIKDIKIENDNNINKQKKSKNAIIANPEDVPQIPGAFKEMIMNSMRYDAFLGHSVYSEGKETAEIIFLDLERARCMIWRSKSLIRLKMGMSC